MYYCHPALPNEEELSDLASAARLTGIVMERDQNQKAIRRLAYIDELTGLANRANAYQKLAELIETSLEQDSPFGLLYIDLDNFKSINDSLGHNIGDELLAEIGKRLNEISGDADYVARLGGDEFCLITQNTDGKGVSDQMVEDVLENISRPLVLSSRKIKPSISIGIAHYPADGQDPTGLIKAADTALYSAKESGKNQYVFYKPELTKQADYQLQIEQALIDAIENRRLRLCYQPQVNLNTGGIDTVEALCRWHDDTLGEVPPNEFIPIVEKLGMMRTLTEWLIDSAAEQVALWEKSGKRAVKVAINAPASEFRNSSIVDVLKKSLEQAAIKPSQLELEVTETTIQTSPENLVVLEQIRQLGIPFVIDDFGIGCSSLSSLKHFPVSSLKMDRYFVQDMVGDAQSQILVSSMIEMGRKLGLSVIAEGVETEEQLALLKELGCETAQGFLFSRALPADQLAELLPAV